MSRHIPNLFTLSNLFCGCCALLFTLYGLPTLAAWFVLGCFIFDYADGMAARMLGISSPLGKQLDSLADVVSFGVVPGAMLYMLLSDTTCGVIFPYGGFSAYAPLSAAPGEGGPLVCAAALPAFVLPMFAAMRLGKFNIDTRQSKYFIGLSTPACTVFVLGLALSAYHNRFGLKETIENQWIVYGVIALFSWLMNSEIPMFGMKIKSFDLKSNAFSLVFLAVFIVLFVFIKELAFSAVIVFYILTSVFLKNKVLAT